MTDVRRLFVVVCLEVTDACATRGCVCMYFGRRFDNQWLVRARCMYVRTWPPGRGTETLQKFTARPLRRVIREPAALSFCPPLACCGYLAIRSYVHIGFTDQTDSCCFRWGLLSCNGRTQDYLSVVNPCVGGLNTHRLLMRWTLLPAWMHMPRSSKSFSVNSQAP